MPRAFLTRYLPDPKTLFARKELRIFGKLLEDPYLLHLNRRSVAGAVALGLFVAFIPIPGQMAVAGALAMLFRVNLVISAMMVWLTNPITMPPALYLCHRVGSWLLGQPPGPAFNPSLEWLWGELGAIWKPLFVGSLAVGSVAALIGYVTVQLLWRLHVVRALKQRRQFRQRQADLHRANEQSR
jgi:uncharacterized protein (DUF2062 family)